MASKLSIGLVTSASEECDQMVRLLKGEGIEIRYHLSPVEINNEHIEDDQLNVWLLNVNDSDWHDNIDLLLDESETSIYFNEPGTLVKQAHPEFWCKSLVTRLYEITGLTNDAPANVPDVTPSNEKIETNKENLVEEPVAEPIDDLSFALDELESSAVDLPSEVAANLVSELESISPELDTDLPELKLDSPAPQENNGVIVESLSEPETILEDDFSEYNSLGDASFDDLDFSNNNPPILESAKDGHDNVLESSFSISEPEPEPDQAVSSEVDEVQTLEVEKFDKNTKLSESNDFNDLSLEEMADNRNEAEKKSTEAQSNQPQGMANFLSEEGEDSENQEEEISLDDLLEDSLLESDGLALESLDLPLEAPVSGKAVYIEAPEDQEQVAMSAKEDTFEEELSGLSLEITQEETPSGKAVFIEDEIELDEPSNVEIDSPAEEDLSGLTLESNGNEAPTGKAVFIEEEVAQHDPAPQAEQKNATDTIADLDDGGLTLELDGRPSTSGRAEFLIDKTEADLTDVDAVSLGTLGEAPALEENQTLQVDPLVNEEPVPVTTSVSVELLTSAEESAETAAGNIETFEIPMLEESVMDVDFDEPASVIPPETPMTPCWVIGASLGGPAAVKRFFQSMPPDINACFVVVQHIDESFLSVMAEILTSNSHFDVEVANGSNAMQAGKVYLAPLKGKIVFLQDGSMLVDHSQKWSEPYSPCIDDVISSMAPVYGELCGSIIFSGMGEDGLKGCEKLVATGGAVWAQSADTCANSSMPNAVINANLASIVATPEILADRLAKTLSETVYG